MISTCLYAQVELKDLLGLAGTVTTQDPVLQKVVKPGLFIIRQQYQLCNDSKGTYHGKNGMSYFGESFSIAIKINKGYMLTNLSRMPWLVDEDFQEVDARMYNPVLFDGYIRRVDNKTYEKYKFHDKYISTLVDSLLFDYDTGERDFGFKIDETNGVKKGTLVICYSDTALVDKADADVMLSTKAFSMTVSSKDSLTFETQDLNVKNVIGGVFVVPEVSQIGQVNYLIAGVLVKTIKNKWFVVSTAKSFAERGKSEQDDVKKTSRQEKKEDKKKAVNITPIKQGKKK